MCGVKQALCIKMSTECEAFQTAMTAYTEQLIISHIPQVNIDVSAVFWLSRQLVKSTCINEQSHKLYIVCYGGSKRKYGTSICAFFSFHRNVLLIMYF